MTRILVRLILFSILSIVSVSVFADCHNCDWSLIPCPPGESCSPMCNSVSSTEQADYGSCVSPRPGDAYCTNLSPAPPPPTCNAPSGGGGDKKKENEFEDENGGPCSGGPLGCPAECASC